MSWSRFEPGFTRHPKRLESGVVASWLWLCSVDHCTTYLTDGIVRDSAVGALSPMIQGRMLAQAVDALLACRAWERVADGYRVHDYLKHHPSAAQIESQRQGARDRYIRWARQRAENAVSNPLPTDQPNALLTHLPNAEPTRLQSVSQSLLESKTGKALCSAEMAHAGAARRNGYREDARQILDFLNRRTGHTYRPVATTLRLIEARLRSGATRSQIQAVIAVKASQWGADPKMLPYLRPETLFRASKFESYLGELPSTAFTPDDQP